MKKSTKRGVLVVAMLAVLIACIVWLYRHFERTNSEVLQGIVECRSYRSSSKLAGRIDSLFVSEGDMVSRGELLYTISTPELDAKLKQVAALEAAAEAINREVDMGARKQQVDAARSMLNKAEAGLTLALTSYERVKNLYDKGVAPRQQYDEALANYRAMQATVDAASAEYALVREGATREQRKAVEAKVKEAQGAVDEVNAYLRDARVYAPISGWVSNIVAEPGELVGSGYPVVTILDFANRWVTFNIKEDMLKGVGLGHHFRGYIPAMDRWVNFEIYYISSEADFATWSATRARGGFDIRTFEVRAKALDEVDMLPGMSVVVYGHI
jgi:HlyD family secretion protein